MTKNVGRSEMKILIEESVLRQALDSMHYTILTGEGITELDEAFYPLRRTLDAAEKVEPTFDKVCKALIGSRVVDAEAIDDADAYDDGVMLERIKAFHRRLYAAPTPPTNTDESLVQLANRLAEVIEERDELYKMGLAQSKTINKLEALFRHDELREAAQAVVDRYKDGGDIWVAINRLREALK